MIGVNPLFPVFLSKGVENYSKKINLLKREWVFLCPLFVRKLIYQFSGYTHSINSHLSPMRTFAEVESLNFISS